MLIGKNGTLSMQHTVLFNVNRVTKTTPKQKLPTYTQISAYSVG